MACPAPISGTAFLSSMLAHFDCQAQSIGSTGYTALASIGSPANPLLTALVTLFVALFGVRMMFGSFPGLGEATFASLKIGLALLLATSWPAWRVLAYDLVLKGPAEVVATMSDTGTLPGSDGGLVARLQGVDDAIVALTDLGSGGLDPGPEPAGPRTAPLHRSISDDLALGGSRLLYLGAILAAFGLVRIAGGLLLALAPLMAGLLLFEATRGLFAGWLRMLVGVALASIAVTIGVSVELAILEPWFNGVLALRNAAYATPSAPIELLVVTLAFAAILIGLIAFAVRMAFGQARDLWAYARRTADAAVPRSVAQPTTASVFADAGADGPVSRANLVSDALAAQMRREADPQLTSRGSTTEGPARQNEMRSGRTPVIVPLGQSQRRVNGRVSASAARRSQAR